MSFMIYLLFTVKDSEPFRKAVEEVQSDYVSFGLKLSQSQEIFKAFKTIRTSAGWNSLTEAQKRIIDSEIRDAELSGVALTGAAKERFNVIQQTLAQLSTNFSNNVLDATKALSVRLTTREEVDGLPESALGLAAQTARSRGDAEATAEKGPWVITLDMPSYMPVMQYAKDRALRERLYRAYQTRASELGHSDGKDLDNTPVALQILALRKERAALLGKRHHAVRTSAHEWCSRGGVEGLSDGGTRCRTCRRRPRWRRSSRPWTSCSASAKPPTPPLSRPAPSRRTRRRIRLGGDGEAGSGRVGRVSLVHPLQLRRSGTSNALCPREAVRGSPREAVRGSPLIAVRDGAGVE
jgi:hypothetical protein